MGKKHKNKRKDQDLTPPNKKKKARPSPAPLPPPEPVAPPTPVEPAIPEDDEDTIDPEQTDVGFFQRWKANFIDAREFCVERIVDVAIFAGAFAAFLRKGFLKVTPNTYWLTILVSQGWLSLSFLYFGLKLLRQSGLKFRFPLEAFENHLFQANEAAAWYFRLVVLVGVFMASVEALLTLYVKRSRVKEMQKLFNLLLAQFIMYYFVPFANNLGDYVNSALTIVTAFRTTTIMLKSTPEQMVESFFFLPWAPMYHFVFLGTMASAILYCEINCIFEEYLGSKREQSIPLLEYKPDPEHSVPQLELQQDMPEQTVPELELQSDMPEQSMPLLDLQSDERS